MPKRVRTVTLMAALAAAGFAACVEETDELPSGADNPNDERSQGALLTAPSKSPRTIAAMMFDIGNGAPNASTIMNVVGGTGSSQRHMYQEISYGIQDTTPEYFGPFTLPVHNCLTIVGSHGQWRDRPGVDGRSRQDLQPLLLGLRRHPVGRELRDLGR